MIAPDLAIVRLNLLVELLSECAGVTELDSLLRIAGGRVRWIVGFDRCTLAVLRGNHCFYWTVTRAEDKLQAIAGDEVAEEHRVLLDRALASGAPGFNSRPVSALCAPLLSAERVLGAICFSSTRERYGYRDLRFVHHIAQCLSSTITRLGLKNEADEASQRKDDFLALLSHELRNPLAPITTAVHLLELRSPNEVPKEVAIIGRQAKHLLRLVDDLLDVSRLTHGKVLLNKAPTEVSRVIARAVEMSSPLFEQHAHRLDLAVPSAGLLVSADPDRLAQVVSNLLSNAARYTDAGGRIAVTARREGSGVLVEVSDNGMGISQEMLPHIFDQFVRGPGAADRAQSGLGLGLSIVKTLTELHGGTASALSKGLGQGSTFSIRLPALPEDFVAPIHESKEAGLERAKTPKRVLLVDDNEDAVETLAEILRAAGHDVRVAYDGPQALAMIAQYRPAVAVLDIGLPVMDGYELAEAIRRKLGVETPYLMALTGYGQEGDHQRSRAAGFATHFVKPVEADVLLEAIAAAANLSPA
jgi:signal transduction histidine kinase/ActR/RegA family two-component response regulator